MTSSTVRHVFIFVSITSPSAICPELRLNDQVVIRNCPPISARKRFKLETVVKSPEREREEHHRRLAEEAAEAAKTQTQGQTQTATA